MPSHFDNIQDPGYFQQYSFMNIGEHWLFYGLLIPLNGFLGMSSSGC